MYITMYVLYNDVCNKECGLQLWNKVDTYLLTVYTVLLRNVPRMMFNTLLLNIILVSIAFK